MDPASRFTLLAAEEEAEATACASPTLSSSPSNVTREFSEAQLRFAVLNRANMVFSNRGIEKLV